MRHRLLQWILVMMAMAYSCPEIFGQKTQIDSLKSLLRTNAPPTHKAEVLEALCFQFFASSEYDSMARYQAQLGQIVHTINVPRLQTLSEFYLIQTLYSEDTAKFFRERSATLATSIKLGCNDCIALNYLSLGMKYQELQQYSIAQNNLQLGIESIEKIDTRRALEIRGILYTTQSSCYHQMGKFSEALQIGLEAMRTAESLNDISLKQKVYSNLSAVYGELSSPNNKLGTVADRVRYSGLAKKYMIKAYESSLPSWIVLQ